MEGPAVFETPRVRFSRDAPGFVKIHKADCPGGGCFSTGERKGRELENFLKTALDTGG